jgi:outer membrane immunogenic protein
MKLLLLAGLAATALFGGSAGAAELAKPPIYPPSAAAIAYFSWTGCYVGGNVGGLWTKEDFSDPIFGIDVVSHTAGGILGGVQAGCNYQGVSNWVLGIQGDYDWTNASGNNAAAVGFPVTNQSQVRSLASVTARVGYAWDRFVGYVKSGGAWQRSNYNVLFGGLTVATGNATRSGWTLGVGGEYAFLNWLTGFVEYDYYGFDAATNTLSPTVTNSNVVKAGLNFKFGD